MRAIKRLARLERRLTFGTSKQALLSDEELNGRIRTCIIKMGIDWKCYEKDPVATAERFFEGKEDPGGHIKTILTILRRADCENVK